jgi:hypothetical protein
MLSRKSLSVPSKKLSHKNLSYPIKETQLLEFFLYQSKRLSCKSLPTKFSRTSLSYPIKATQLQEAFQTNQRDSAARVFLALSKWLYCKRLFQPREIYFILSVPTQSKRLSSESLSYPKKRLSCKSRPYQSKRLN